MMLPPLIVGAALLFWGWQSGNLAIAIPLALAIEVLRWKEVRFDLEPPRYNQLADLCTVAFVLLAVALVANRGVPHGVLAGFQYVPVVLAPILLAQYAASVRRIRLSALFRYLRKLKAREPATRDPLVDLSGPYFAVTLIAAGMANQRDHAYYLAILGFAAWALWQHRPRHAPLAASIALFALAGGLGFAGHLGLNHLQEALEDWFSEWQMRQATDPSRVTSDMGSIGRLKQYDAVLLRVHAPRDAADRPKLLHRASFNSFGGVAWQAKNMPLAPLQAEADGSTWVFGRGEAPRSVRIAAKSDAGRTLLPLPAGTMRVSGLAAAQVRRNDFGAVLAEAPESWMRYEAHFSGMVANYEAPLPDDLVLSTGERATLERIAGELGLRGLAPADAVKRVSDYLGGFRYSTYLERPAASGVTPLANFLANTQAGHCEFFAAATVMLLRAAGVPARYATGFAALEYSELEGAWVVRARHAHAWTRAFVDGRWIELDTTPPSWFAEEAKSAPFWQPLADLFRWGAYRWSQRGEAGQMNAWWYALAGLLFAILAWRIVKGRRTAAMAAHSAAAEVRRWQGEDSEFYALEAAIAARYGPRTPAETASAWLARVKPDEVMRAQALAALALHERYRFDPQGLAEDERRALRESSLQLASAVSVR
jgi:hypothetical protein